MSDAVKTTRPWRRSHAEGETDDSYRWMVLLVTSVGALLASLNSGTLVIALPDILRDLHTDIFALMWIIVGYTLVTTVLVLNAGRLADSIGRVRAYTLGFAIFLIGSVLCALAPNAITLIGARVVQGVGGAFLMATSAALVTDAFPRRELGRALGVNAMVVGAGLILGPILGGWLTGFGWRTVFWLPKRPTSLKALFSGTVSSHSTRTKASIISGSVARSRRRSAVLSTSRHGTPSSLNSPKDCTDSVTRPTPT
jgi:MFS family permease